MQNLISSEINKVKHETCAIIADISLRWQSSRMGDTKNSSETNAETDFLPFFRSNKTEALKLQEPGSDALLPYADEYKMDHRRRGLAVIFNHVNFIMPDLNKRNGSNMDRDALVKMCYKLNFDVVVHNDLMVHEVESVLFSVSQMDHTDADCLLVIVMSHGDNAKIFAKDKEYPTRILWEHFSAQNCITLAGKPKLLFIQACRGQGLHPGHILHYKAGPQKDSLNTDDVFYTIPTMADILVMYSTMEGFYSWRDPQHGSIFIQSLVRQLSKLHQTKDLLTILTFVNREVAIDFTSQTPDVPQYNGRKQMCSIVSMLTRLLYFSKKDENGVQK